MRIVVLEIHCNGPGQGSCPVEAMMQVPSRMRACPCLLGVVLHAVQRQPFSGGELSSLQQKYELTGACELEDLGLPVSQSSLHKSN